MVRRMGVMGTPTFRLLCFFLLFLLLFWQVFLVRLPLAAPCLSFTARSASSLRIRPPGPVAVTSSGAMSCWASTLAAEGIIFASGATDDACNWSPAFGVSPRFFPQPRHVFPAGRTLVPLFLQRSSGLFSESFSASAGGEDSATHTFLFFCIDMADGLSDGGGFSLLF